MSVSILPLDPGGESAWDAFVRASPEGTFFHLSGWKSVVEKAFGHRTYYLTAQRGGILSGILPLTHVKSLLFGDSLISNAFCMYGGIIATDAESSDALKVEALRIGRELKVDCLEFRSKTPSHPDWIQRGGLYFDFQRPLLADAEANMKAIPRKRRNHVRKGISQGLTSVSNSDVDTMYDVYAESVRNLGTPVYSKRYFKLLKEQFGSDIDIVTVHKDGRPVSSAMNFYFRDLVIPYYAGGTFEARSLSANDFMFWEVMRRACEKGVQIFDFGRSKLGTGPYDFKTEWGFKPEPIVHEFMPIASQKIPENNPLNPKYSLMISTWQRLPLFLTKIIGPPIVRQIG